MNGKARARRMTIIGRRIFATFIMNAALKRKTDRIMYIGLFTHTTMAIQIQQREETTMIVCRIVKGMNLSAGR